MVFSKQQQQQPQQRYIFMTQLALQARAPQPSSAPVDGAVDSRKFISRGRVITL